jgi:formylglycine-generating enzyme required for sulfatase activity
MPQVLRWQSTTQAFHEALGDGESLTMVRIPAGRFQMGSPMEAAESGRDGDEGPVHGVELEEFLIASTPITQAQWRVVAEWEQGPAETWRLPLESNPSLFQGDHARLRDGEPDSSQRPVDAISWDEASEFCRRLSQRTGRHYTLPSEAQWEYACRAGSSTPYAFGFALTAALANLRLSTPAWAVAETTNSEPADVEQTTPVGLYPANAWGLYDMHGNLWEWCLDHWRESYSGVPIDGSAWIDANAPATAERVLRGGSWSDSPADSRSACRRRLPARAIDAGALGLRVVCLPGMAGRGELADRAGSAQTGVPNADEPVNGQPLDGTDSLEMLALRTMMSTSAATPVRSSAFVSYSHKDSKWLDKLNVMLTPFTRDGMAVWSDQKIKPGDLYAEEIRKALENAKVAILLVSPDFLASQYIHDNELPPLLGEAERGGLTILWIPIHYSNYKQTKIKDYQAVWEPSQPLAGLSKAKLNQALVAISETIAEAMER